VNTIYLDSEKTSALEPFEWEIVGQRGSGISPFSVPYGMIIERERSGGAITAIRFEYPSNGPQPPPEDKENDLIPGLSIWMSRFVPRMTRIAFDPPVFQSGLVAMADRMESLSRSITPISKRFSYVMIARIIKAWSDIIVSSIA
jgi:hypothetical protein